MPNVVTMGKLLVNDIVPEDMRDPERIFDKKQSTAFFTELAEKHPEKYAEVLQRLNNISRVVGTEYGEVASVRLKDLQLPPRIKEYRKALRGRIQEISQDPKLTGPQKNERIVGLMDKAIPIIQKNLQDETFNRDNAFGESIKNGFRGSPIQLTQILFGDMLVADHKGRPIPVPGVHGYAEGVTPTEYWAGTYGSRKGYSDVQFATAKTGFLGKQLAMMAQRQKITGEDCGATDVGITVDGDDPELLGTVLAADAAGIKKGTVIEKSHLNSLKKTRPLVRSVVTCQQPEGICQRCAGKQDQGKFPEIGSYVGITAARVVSEPMTQQLGLSAKHTGGTPGSSRDAEVSGFDEINQFVQIPKSFRGASVLSPGDGKVKQIVKAPQGGHYIHVNDEQLYVPPNRNILVRKGDTVEAGDTLTDGTPNPADIARHKGLGEGRMYFTTKFYEILKNNGVPTHRRNVESLARAFFDKVRITNPDGVMGHNINDIVSYSDLQREYVPRQDAGARAPGRSVGQFLERPILHYTIGTRVTKKMAKHLETAGIKGIVVHKQDPGFSPEVIRLQDIPSKDPDWKAKMSGFGLKKSFLESARRGAESKHESTSYVGALMDPSRL